MSLNNSTYSFAGRWFEVPSVLDASGQLWLVANPFARSLGYTKPNDTLTKIVNRDNQRQLEQLVDVAGVKTTKAVQRSTKFINEAGLNELITHSCMPVARDFRYNETPIVLQRPSTTTTLTDAVSIHPHVVVGCMYIGSTDELRKRGIYKIGWTTDYDEKRKELDAVSPHAYQLDYAFETVHFRPLTHHLYRMFASKRINRDFFVMTHENFAILNVVCCVFVNKAEL